MRALSFIQPWAWLVVRPDLVDPVRRGIATRKLTQIKGVENRVWNTQFRGRFLIHASKRMAREDYESAIDFAAFVDQRIEVPPYEQIECGGIVGAASLIDVLPPLERPSRPWHMPYQYGFILGDVTPLPFRAWKGARRWWDYPGTADELTAAASPLERSILEMATDEIGRVSVTRLRNTFGAERSDDQIVFAIHDLLSVGLLVRDDQAGWYRLAERAEETAGT